MSILENRFFLPAITTIAFVITIVINALGGSTTVLNGKNTGDISDAHPNRFVPAGWAFSIWSLIYLLLAIYVVYLWVLAVRGRRSPFFYSRVGWLLPANFIFNALWMIFWQYEVWVLTIILMIGILGTLLASYVRAGVSYFPVGWNRKARSAGAQRDATGLNTFEFWILQATLSIYSGWISVATIANVTLVITVADATAPSVGTAQGWSCGMQVVAVVLAALMLYTRGDFLYAGVVSWALFAISDKQRHFAYVYAVAQSLAVLVLVLLLLQALHLAVLRIGAQFFHWQLSDTGVATFGAATAGANRGSFIGTGSSGVERSRSPKRKHRRPSSSNRV